MGATMRHGPHQAAQKSMMASPCPPSITVAKLLSVTSTVRPLTAIPCSLCARLPTRLHGRAVGSALPFPARPFVQDTGRSVVMELTLDHVAIAVTSIAEAQPVLESLMGGHSSAVERVEAQ